MIRPICKDPLLLALKGRDATMADSQIAEDLKETLKANLATCVGMGANMIGQPVRIIAFVNQETGRIEVHYNPSIVRAEGKYKAEEGCLSLDGTRPTERFKKIKIQFQDEKGTVKLKTYEGFTAQIIQHEIDHTNGILI